MRACPWTHKISRAISLVALVAALILISLLLAGVPFALQSPH